MMIESMKMEIAVRSPTSGRISRVSAETGQPVRAGQLLGAIIP
jgi:biotin carboxyl carrier protein